MHLTSMFHRQIPFEHFHLNATINPGKLEVGFKIRGTYHDEIPASYILLMKDAVTAARIPKQNGSIRTNQSQSGMVAPCRSINNDHL
ncbi:MAG: hypothetical protein A2026_17675 [Deltaproteobacteria bacterium RBG_19FT_COMBO_46_12]|nr:MAG: hypothetical protein A2026_17675 [Deltaproteobacteria bacterium RBG_19FT_COMBO_46_12]